MTPAKRMWTYVATGVAGTAVGLWLVTLWLPGWLGSQRAAGTGTARPGTEASASGPSSANDARRISATLFYITPGGDALVPVEQDVPYAAAPADQARRIVERQLAPAPAGQTSSIPAGTTLRALFLTSRGEAYVDLSKEVVAGHPGGSLHEALTVYAIVNALTVNLPDISAVQVLVDGKEVDTLVGHLDLRHPLRRGTRWMQRTP
ncbi:MAG: GerMN domain-containing protein [Vicinamibacterales bacterium]